MRPPKLLPILVLLLAPSLLRAQQAPPPTPAPKAPAPCMAQAPANSSWTILIRRKEDRAAKAGGAAQGMGAMQGGPTTGAKPSFLEQIQVEKAGTTRRILRKWSDGKVQDAWWIGPLCLAEFPTPDGPPDINVIDTAGPVGLVDPALIAANASGGGYKKNDFPELDWIEPSLLAGTETRNDRLYRVYRITATTAVPTKPRRRKDMTILKSLQSATGDAKPSAQATTTPPASASPSPGGTKMAVIVIKEAWIDALTGLPLSFTEGDDTWNYSFSSGSGSLQLPPRFEEALRAYKQDQESAKHRTL